MPMTTPFVAMCGASDGPTFIIFIHGVKLMTAPFVSMRSAEYGPILVVSIHGTQLIVTPLFFGVKR